MEIKQRRVIADAWGVDHEWVCTPFGTLAAVSHLARLMDIVLGGDAGRNLDSILDGDVSRLRDVVQSGGILGLLGGVPRRLLDAGGGEVLVDLLSECRRDAGNGKYVPMDRSAIDTVGRGNLPEILAAARWVVEVNYGPLWRAAIAGLQGVLSDGAATPDVTPGELSAV